MSIWEKMIRKKTEETKEEIQPDNRFLETEEKTEADLPLNAADSSEADPVKEETGDTATENPEGTAEDPEAKEPEAEESTTEELKVEEPKSEEPPKERVLSLEEKAREEEFLRKNKEWEKESRRRMKKVVGGFRFRSLGIDLGCILALGVEGLLAMVLNKPLWGVSAAVVLTLLGIIAEWFSWIGCGRELRKIQKDTDESLLRQSKAWKIGESSIRFQAVLLSWELPVAYFLAEGLPLTWVRWAAYAGIYTVLMILILMVLTSWTDRIAYGRGIFEEDSEENDERRLRGRTALPWQLLGVLLLVLTVMGQTAFHQYGWKKLESGTTWGAYEEFRAFVEEEKAIPEDVDDGRIETDGRILDGDGNVLYRFTIRNGEVYDYAVGYDEKGREPASFTVYTWEDRVDGLWKKEAANLVWFVGYGVEIILCFAGYRSRLKKKMNR